MSKLLILPNLKKSKIQDLTPEKANWKFVGFEVHDLKKGETLTGGSNQREFCVVLLSGSLFFKAESQVFGLKKGRESVFDTKPPIAMYVPMKNDWEIKANEKSEVAICSAPGTKGQLKPRIINSKNMSKEIRGKGSNTRYICNILPENEAADSLLVVEVVTPSGNWSSYPPHKHDTDNLPHETYLEETYYHRVRPNQGYVVQRVYNDNRTLDENISATDRSVVMVPEGYHPVGVPYGYKSYYLNVMAGPKRIWKFQNDPDHDWITKL